MELLTKEQLEELELKYKRIAHVIGFNKEWEVVFRKPSRAEYKLFRANATNESKKAEATEMLCRATVIVPSKEKFDELLEDFPGICEASSTALLHLCGLAVDESLK